MRLRFLIGGRVHGVGFRYFARRTATTHGISGWVRNLPTGQVEAEGQGTPDQLAAFEAALRRGPLAAQVTEFQRIEISDQLDAAGPFEIR